MHRLWMPVILIVGRGQVVCVAGSLLVGNGADHHVRSLALSDEPDRLDRSAEPVPAIRIGLLRGANVDCVSRRAPDLDAACKIAYAEPATVWHLAGPGKIRRCIGNAGDRR